MRIATSSLALASLPPPPPRSRRAAAALVLDQRGMAPCVAPLTLTQSRTHLLLLYAL